jgi:hypothetical protein
VAYFLVKVLGIDPVASDKYPGELSVMIEFVARANQRHAR